MSLKTEEEEESSHDEKRHKCTLCEFSTLSEKGLKTHTSRKHI
jgi:TPR repeat protein